MIIKLKKVTQRNKAREGYDLQKLERLNIRKKYRMEVRNRIQALMGLERVEELSEVVGKMI